LVQSVTSGKEKQRIFIETWIGVDGREEQDLEDE
jgi:hypothetical protein